MDETADASTWKGAVFRPAATRNTGGTFTGARSLETGSPEPEDDASPVSMPVAVEGDPPVTVKGARVKELGASRVPGGTTARIALSFCPLYVAATVTGP